MGHTDAKCVLQSFKEAMKKIHFYKLFQVSMDGPAVNWKFLNLLTNDDESENYLKLVEMESCGLHVVHGTFRSGHTANGWNVNSYLRLL